MPKAPPTEFEIKPKRTLSEDQLAKLKIAREKALVVKKAMKEKSDDGKIKHYEEKIMRLKTKKVEETPDEPPSELLDEPEVEAEVEVEEEPKVIKSIRKKETKEETLKNPPDDNEVDEEAPPPKIKPKSKKKPVVIIEESDSDSSEDSNVVYIKRRGKKRDPRPPQQQPIPAYAHQPPNIPEPPPLRREMIMNPNPFYRHNVMPNYM